MFFFYSNDESKKEASSLNFSLAGKQNLTNESNTTIKPSNASTDLDFSWNSSPKVDHKKQLSSLISPSSLLNGNQSGDHVNEEKLSVIEESLSISQSAFTKDGKICVVKIS